MPKKVDPGMLQQPTHYGQHAGWDQLPFIFIGVDPGQGGGLAALTIEGAVLSCTKMPDTERDVWDWFISVTRGCGRAYGTIEKVHSMPQQGVSSTFKFGVSYGGLRMALVAAKLIFGEVTPQRWIKGLEIPPRKPHRSTKQVQYTKGKNKGKWHEVKYGGETGSEWKNRLKAKAQQLFPQEKVTLATADALLIAEYCRRINISRI